MKQINNLQIRHRKYDPPSFYYVRTPEGRILEEFGTYGGAVIFCETTFDFVINKKEEKELQEYQDFKRCAD